MKHLAILFFIILAYQNCSDVSLIKNDIGIDKYSVFKSFGQIESGQVFASNNTYLVTCSYSNVSLYNLQNLELIDTETTSGYCTKIAIADQWIAVSSNNQNVTVLKIENNQLVVKQTLNKPAASTSLSGYGNSVALTDSVLVVGDYYHNINANGREGAAYVYRRNNETWNLEQQILSTDPGNTELFGHQVGVSGNNILISARYDNNQGAVYVFGNLNSGTSWSQIQKIRSPDNYNDQQFGFSFSIDGDHLAIAAVAVVGTPIDLSKGTVFMYEKSSDWKFKQRLTASTQNIEDFFGYQVSLKYPILAVSAPQQFSSTLPGFVSIFKVDQGSWILKQEIEEANVTRYGNSLQLSGSRLIVGALNTENKIFVYQPLSN